ncbi:MAG: SPOR domain-containing protein [Armatimonadota bacterium]|nr:SPOR domain-containing protein [Armatimonadota bacterium]
MGLDFRKHEDDGFPLRRFLKTVIVGIGVFLVFMAIGAYVIGPRLEVDESGRLRFRLFQERAAQAAPTSEPQALPLPKVEIYEKLPPDVTAGTGVLIGAREVAPFDYERYQRKQRERRAKRAPAPSSETNEATSVPEDEYFVPEEPTEGDTPPSAPEEVPTDTPQTPEIPKPASPAPEEPNPTAEPTRPSATSNATLYRVQVGVFEKRENANRMVQSLLVNGVEARIVPFQRDGTTFYRVQVLVTRNRAKADALQAVLQSKGFPAVVVEVR